MTSINGAGFAVVVMTRKPYRFESWLDYYRALGCQHIFVSVEDSPDVDALLAEPKWRSMVTASRSVASMNPYETVITRQERVMEWALAECEQRGIPWLFHLDDDELLHFTESWEDILAQVRCLLAPGECNVPSVAAWHRCRQRSRALSSRTLRGCQTTRSQTSRPSPDLPSAASPAGRC